MGVGGAGGGGGVWRGRGVLGNVWEPSNQVGTTGSQSKP